MSGSVPGARRTSERKIKVSILVKLTQSGETRQ